MDFYFSKHACCSVSLVIVLPLATLWATRTLLHVQCRCNNKVSVIRRGLFGGVPLKQSYVFFLLQLDPKRCESCYGAETPEKRCCNTCEDVREAYRRKGWALSDVDDIKQVLMGLLLDSITVKSFIILNCLFLSCDWSRNHEVTLKFIKWGFEKGVSKKMLHSALHSTVQLYSVQL